MNDQPRRLSAELGPAAEPQNRSMAAFHGVFWAAVSILLPALVNMLVFLVTSRLLGPQDFGVVALAGVVAAGAIAVSPAGFGEALVQRASLTASHLDSVFWACMLFGIVAFVVLWASAGSIAALFDSDILVVLVPVFGIRVLVEMAAVVPKALITRSMRFKLVATRTLIATVAGAALSVGLVLSGFGLWALVASQIATTAIGAGVMLFSAGWRPGFRPTWRALRDLTGYGGFASGNMLLQFIGSQADQAAVGYGLGVVPLGLYNFARRVFNLLNDVVSGAIGIVSHPLFSSAQTDRDKVRMGFMASTFVTSVISFPLFFGLGLVADRAVPLLFGDHWLEAVTPLRLLCALGMISCIGVLQSSLIRSQGRADWWFYYQLATNLLSLAVYLVAPFGLTVLLWCMLVKTYLVWPVSIAMTLRLLAVPAGEYGRQFAGPAAACLAMGAVVAAGRWLLPGMGETTGLALDVALGIVSYSAALLALEHRRIGALAAMLLNVSGLASRWKRKPS